MDTQKKTVCASERNPVERLLFADLAATLPAERVIVVDETSTHLDMHPTYAPKGQRAFASAKRNYGHNISLIASLSLRGAGPAMAVEGAVNTAIFTAFVSNVLVPTLKPGDIVVLHNLSCHKASAVRAAIEGVGASLLFLPAYSPDFHPLNRLSVNSKPSYAVFIRCPCQTYLSHWDTRSMRFLVLMPLAFFPGRFYQYCLIVQPT